jgi:hypothetical protein
MNSARFTASGENEILIGMQFTVRHNKIFHAVGTQNWHVINMVVEMYAILVSFTRKGNDVMSFMNVEERVIFEKSLLHRIEV